MAGRVSQDVVEGEITADPNARVSQEVIEGQITADSNARVSQEVIEGQITADSNARVSQLVVEGPIVAAPHPRVSQLVVEVLCLSIEVAMPPVYPTLLGLGYDVKWTPTFFNMPTQTAASGADIDLGLADEPLHDFELQYNFLRDQFGNLEFKTMMGFFLRLGGTKGRFLFKNPDDYAVSGQPQGSTDGSSIVYGPLKRTYGIGDNSGTEAIGWLDQTEPFNMYLDGVLQDTTTYELITDDPKNVQIKFKNTPAGGQAITTDMSYFYYCKFPDNSAEFNKFLNRIWELQKITIHSCRAGT